MASETRGAVYAALAATMGNLLQGWDNATIAGAVIYIKKEFKLETQPTMEGLILAMSLIGATFITTFSGSVSDQLGRRSMLIISSIFYFLGGLVMFWSPNIYVLLLGRLLDGLGVGLAVTLIPIYVSETAPSEIRGQLNTLPQFTGSGGMLFSYCMIFSMSLMDSPSWRLMLGVVSVPSLLYLALTVFYLPESPRWLVSKGKMAEAEKVLQQLRGKEDVSGEMALLVEGLGTGGETSIEEYVISAENEESTMDKNQIKLYGSERGQSWIAKPVTGGQSTLGMVSRYGSVANQSTKMMMDPLVTLFGSVHENVNTTGSMRSMLFPNFGSMFNANDGGNNNNNNHGTNDEWDPEDDGHVDSQDSSSVSDDMGLDEVEETTVKSPLLSRFTSNHQNQGIGGSNFSMRRNSSLANASGVVGGELVNGTGIGGGWQLAWKYSEKSGQGGKKEGEYKRVFLKQEGGLASNRGSVLSFAGGHEASDEPQMVQAAALVSQSAIQIKNLKNQSPGVGEKVKPSKEATQGPSWKELFEPGVKHALIVGAGLQILQQFSGINGVLYYTPQILEQAGVGVLMSTLGLSPSSSSILITTLVLLVIANVVDMGQIPHAVLSTVSVVLYFCCFVMGFGPIPNILCSEIFPTRVRGLCIAICSLVFWFGDITVTYSLPAMLSSIGLAGVFGIYAIVCVLSWIFVYLKVPETKGMPLEVISEFFNVGARQAVESSACDNDFC
ncbi:hypothetical protein V2J09_021656 [Rumex salicifolius]